MFFTDTSNPAVAASFFSSAARLLPLPVREPTSTVSCFNAVAGALLVDTTALPAAEVGPKYENYRFADVLVGGTSCDDNAAK